MTVKRAVSALLLILLISVIAHAQEKATDLMSLALKNKAAGKTGLAIEQLQKAADASPSALVKNLARFMLGDCQLETGRYSQAAKTFEQLRKSASDSEGRAEATYRLLQAETFLQHNKKATRLYKEIQKKYRSSPYYELAKAFVSARKLVSSAQDERVVVAKAVAKPATIKPVKKAKKTVTPVPAKTSTTVQEGTDRKKQTEKALKTFAKPGKTAEKVSVQLADLLHDALTVSVAENKEEMAAEVLELQDKLKQTITNKDRIIFALANKTLEFGETLEACKLFDQILNQFPTSPFVEQAYYNAIRLRAILGVHQAVGSWSKAFLSAFPTSQYSQQIKALVKYSASNGQIDYSTRTKKPATRKANAAATNAAATNSDESPRLKQDRNYAQATRKMKDGKYNLALIDLKKLAQKYPSASQIWWDLALVYVQFEDFPKAEQTIKKMLAITPDNEEGNSLLGYIHYRLEDYQEAASAYGRAGEASGNGVNFFDPKKAAERMKKSVNTGK